MFRSFAIACTLLAQPVHSSGNCAADAMIVFDGSGSMAELGPGIDTPRIFEARKAMRRALPQIEPFRNLGLLIYGPGPLDGCSNIELKLMPRAAAAAPILAEVDQLQPGGMTPIATSVRAAAEALNFRERPSTIVLITDGNETCGGTPCALGESLATSAHDLTIHTIGFKIRIDPFSWDTPEQESYERNVTVAKCLSD
ncbi:MAG: VWA domain-containing protein, partial [Litoreibacter sp.]|nr:VWA domain-containing protein [Litoreibacter sp.]